MTTLTPHRDAANAAAAAMKAALAGPLSQGGEAAVAARLCIAIQSAAIQALADEYDAGTDSTAVGAAFIRAMANTLVSVACSSVGQRVGPPVLAKASDLLLRMSSDVFAIIDNDDPAAYTTAAVKSPATGRA